MPIQVEAILIMNLNEHDIPAPDVTDPQPTQ